MSISSVGMSYSQLRNNSELSIKGENSSEKKTDSSSEKTGSMDAVSLSDKAAKKYKIDGKSVSKAEFEKYDTNKDGKISSSELAAYKANKAETKEKDSDSAIIKAMQESQKEDSKKSVSGYSAYGNLNFRSESGTALNTII